MIYSRQVFYVCCDMCGETIETNAVDKDTTVRVAKELGWECATILAWKGVYCPPKYVNLCPKCKEETK